ASWVPHWLLGWVPSWIRRNAARLTPTPVAARPVGSYCARWRSSALLRELLYSITIVPGKTNPIRGLPQVLARHGAPAPGVGRAGAGRPIAGRPVAGRPIAGRGFADQRRLDQRVVALPFGLHHRPDPLAQVRSSLPYPFLHCGRPFED